MSIKSDQWIKRQCTLPTHVVTYLTGGHRNGKSICVDRFSWLTEEELWQSSVYDSNKIGGFRPLTEEEKAAWSPMIEPFHPEQVRARAKSIDITSFDLTSSGMAARATADVEKVISYGTSSYGYDVRCAPEFKVFTNINSTIVDPKNFDNNSFVEVNSDVCIIPPNSFALARTVERIRIPRNVLTVCLGKSTYARCGIIVNVTPLEPEWEGYVTLEFSNTTSLPAKIYANEGCAQFLFFESDEDCAVSYKDRQGKYMNQAAQPIPPKL